jgi:alpha-methylacyl-CoA racemase
MPGPLHGLKVIEMVGIGPTPFCGMLLADLGAEVLRIDRPRPAGARGDTHVLPDDARFDVLARGRSGTVTIDLKRPGAVDDLLAVLARADAVIEGFRPGTMERLGLGPDVCQAINPRLVYGRMTGWGQTGPLAQAAGHDIDYIALSGALHAIGPRDGKPTVPLNYLGDFGGGGMLLAVGVLAALLEAKGSGRGQVVDAAMVDGSALLSAMMYGFKANGWWSSQRGTNMLDGGAHFYDTYRCADGKYVAVGAIEPQFYATLRERCGLVDAAFDAQMDASAWPAQKEKLADVFATRTRDAWCALLEGSDACFAPVLDWDEAPRHPHNVARDTFVAVDGVMQPAPAPRFSRTRTEVPGSMAGRAPITQVLQDWAIDGEVVERLCGGGPPSATGTTA